MVEFAHGEYATDKTEDCENGRKTRVSDERPPDARDDHHTARCEHRPVCGIIGAHRLRKTGASAGNDTVPGDDEVAAEDCDGEKEPVLYPDREWYRSHDDEDHRKDVDLSCLVVPSSALPCHDCGKS